MSRVEEQDKNEEMHWKTFVGRDLNALAAQKTIGPIYDREHIISNLSSLLVTRENNPLLVGEPGVGKNAVVEGLALWMDHKKVALPFDKIIQCSVISFQSGCLYAHEFETKIQVVVDRLRKEKAILFFDEINTAIWSGGTSGDPQRTLATLLAPYLARNELTIIGATTPNGYMAMQKGNSSFTNKFVKVDMPTTSLEETRQILYSLRSTFKRKYNVTIEQTCLDALTDMCDRFYRERAFPGKAFEVLREAIAYKDMLPKKDAQTDPPPLTQIESEDIFKAFERRTALPKFMIHRNVTISRDEIKEYFAKRIFGQDEAVNAIADTILTMKAELNDPGKPVAAFLFAGPTGVGKTWLAKLVAEYLFGSEGRLLRYDMPEFANYDSMLKLIGGRGWQEPGRLVDDVLGNPFSVILFDEIEKAHLNIFDLLLPVLGEGRLTDNIGRTVSFSNTIIIMTSNVGAESYTKIPMGLKPQLAKATRDIDRDLIKKVESYFRPEFINRLTRIVQFRPLAREDVETIARIEVEKLVQRKGVSSRKLQIEVSQQVINLLVDTGYSHAYGARPMQRAVEKLVGYPLSEAICSGDICDLDKVLIDLNEAGAVQINRVELSVDSTGQVI